MEFHFVYLFRENKSKLIVKVTDKASEKSYKIIIWNNLKSLTWSKKKTWVSKNLRKKVIKQLPEIIKSH